MNTFSVHEQPPPSLPVSVGDDMWQAIIDLLKTQKYQEVIEILHKQQTTAVLYEDAEHTTLLGIATQICQACVQHQAEIESFRQSQAQAMLREQELKQQLIRMFELMSHSAPIDWVEEHHELPKEFPVKPAPGDEPVKAPRGGGIWQRVQTLLGNKQHTDDIETTSGQFVDHSYQSNEAYSDEDVKRQTVINSIQTNEQSPLSDIPEKAIMSVYCLGTFCVYLNGRQIENWNGNKSKSVFKYMVLHKNQPANHEVLMDLFWHGDDPEAARRNLYQAIYVIRQALHDKATDFQHIICQDSAYSFNPQVSIWVDSAMFEEHYQNGLQLQREGKIDEAIQELEKADSLYEGDFLREDIFEEWTLVHRERLKHAHLDTLDRLSQYYWAEEQYPLSITYGLKILQGDNCREDVHRRLMSAYYHQGQRHLALKQYYRCVELLSEELGVEPMAETNKLYQRILNAS